MGCRDLFESATYYTVYPLGIFFNVFALYIIKNKCNHELSSYKVILLTNCIADLIISTILFVLDPHIRTFPQNEKQPIFYYFGIIRFLTNHWSSTLQQTLYTIHAIFQSLISCLPVPPFVYRYLMICRNKRVSNMQILLIYFIFCIPALLYAPFFLYLCIKYESKAMATVTKNGDMCPGEKFFVIYLKSLLEGELDLTLHYAFNIINTSVLLCYPILLFFHIKILRFLRAHQSHIQNVRLQTEITRTLSIQALFPIFLTGIPGVIGRFLSFSSNSNHFAFANYYTLFRAWIPLLNPLITIYFIKAFRKNVIEIFRAPNYLVQTESSGNAMSSNPKS